MRGSQPSKYYKGVDKKDKKARAKHFAKYSKYDDDDPRAYKPAPGDEDIETKPSKYTQKYKRMFSENTETALKKKAEETGVSYSILKKVFDRGVAAWRTGHRPGTNAVQWGLARVNSFVTGGKTQKTADKDLWAKHKGKKESTQVNDEQNITEVLSKDEPLVNWIRDFEKSDAPQFDGKSKKKRREMAIAAYLDPQRG